MGGLAARGALGLAILAVGALVVHAALGRQIHIDEFHNVYSMQLVGAFGHADYADPAELYHVVFSALSRQFSSTRAMFTALRLVYGLLFVGLLVAVTWVQPYSRTPLQRLAVFVGVATWWPAWRHGFEIRHDLLLAYGVVGLFAIISRVERERRADRLAALSAGVIAPLMQLNSHKAVTLWGPALMLLVAFAASRGRRAALEALAWLAVGALGGAAVGLGVLAWGGALGAYFAQLEHFSKYAAAADGFPASNVLWYMAERGTVLSLLAVVLLVATVVFAARRRWPVDTATPCVFVLVAVASLSINPAPFPYNLVWLTPSLSFAGIAGAREVLWWCRQLSGPRLSAACWALGSVAVVAQFGVSLLTDEYASKRWDDQLALTDAAEALTAPDEPVFDGVGMVCTRPPASRHWLLHYLMMPEYRAGEREQVEDIVERASPPVILPAHYRFGWLPKRALAAIRKHYAPVSRELWVLGARLKESPTQVELLRAGRYMLSTPSAGGPVQVDGRDYVAPAIIELSRGVHHTAGEGMLRWLGPSASELPALPPTMERLFAPPRLEGQR